MFRNAVITALVLSTAATVPARADYLTITMTNVQVTSVQDNGGAAKTVATGGISRNR